MVFSQYIATSTDVTIMRERITLEDYNWVVKRTNCTTTRTLAPNKVSSGHSGTFSTSTTISVGYGDKTHTLYNILRVIVALRPIVMYWRGALFLPCGQIVITSQRSHAFSTWVPERERRARREHLIHAPLSNIGTRHELMRISFAKIH